MAQAVALQDDWEFGYPDGPEMNEYKLQMQKFEKQWEQMQSALTVAHCELEISSKSPENLLQEIIQQMESECKNQWCLMLFDFSYVYFQINVFHHMLSQMHYT